MKNKVWVDADVWVQQYDEKALGAWYQDRKKYKKKRDELRLKKFREEKKKKKRDKDGKKKTAR